MDQEPDALCLALDDSSIVDSDEAAPGIVVDLNDKNDVVGAGILRLSKRTPRL